MKSKIQVFDLFVPIGELCITSWNLRQNHLQTESLPFDWLANVKLDYALNFIENNFNCFLKRENLTFVKRENHEAHFKMPNGIVFKHDFRSENLEDFSKVEQKYKRRIKRLYQKIDKADSILFVHFSTIPLSKSNISGVYSRLLALYPCKNIKLLVVLMDESFAGYEILENNEMYEIVRLEHHSNETWVGKSDFIKEIFAAYHLSLKTRIFNFLISLCHFRKKVS